MYKDFVQFGPWDDCFGTVAKKKKKKRKKNLCASVNHSCRQCCYGIGDPNDEGVDGGLCKLMLKKQKRGIYLNYLGVNIVKLMQNC